VLLFFVFFLCFLFGGGGGDAAVSVWRRMEDIGETITLRLYLWRDG